MVEDDEDAREKSYLGQKREVLEVLSEYIERGNTFIKDDSKSEEDRQEVETGLSVLRASVIGFYDFLESGFAVGEFEDPIVLNIAQFLRGAIGGASIAFRHLDAPLLTTKILHDEATKIARGAKRLSDEDRKAKQREVLREMIGPRTVTQPYKEADAIFDTDAERTRFKLICETHGLEPFSLSTARKRFGEMSVSKKG